MVASEATPFSKTGGLADVIGALPPALKHAGEEVAVVLPAYRVNRYPIPPREAYRNIYIALGRGYTVDVYLTVERDVPFYFIDCPALFDRDGIYNSDGVDYPDNYLRFAVFSMAALNVARHLFRPDVLHCHDWQSGLVPVYVESFFRNDPTFISIRTLFTIHNLGYQGLFPAAVLPAIGLSRDLLTPDRLEFYGQVNYLKGGIGYSDGVSTVSRGYAREIQTPEYGFGLDGFLRTHARRLTGIPNGADYMEWSPEHDSFIAAPYSAEDLTGKRTCKLALLDELGLPADNPGRPLIGMVSRFANQKGFDLIAAIAGDLASLDAQFAILGSGDPAYEALFKSLAARYPAKFGVRVGYDNALAHRIEAGADMFLMPSQYEPSGLNQIYSLRYGTIPIVRATGGLDDTIDETTGFKFWDYSGAALLSAVETAISRYRQTAGWTAMMARAMQKDFSWAASALQYAALYRELRSP